MMSAITEVVAGAETIRAYEAGDIYGTRAAEAIDERAKAQIRAGILGALLFPSGELFSVLTVSGVILVGVARGPAQRADGRGDDRVHVPHVPVPRADRRVHRGARPDPDRGRRPAAGARRARPADRAAAHRSPGAAAGRACSTSTCAGVTFAYPIAGRHDVARRGRAAQRRRVDPGRPAGGDGRRHRIGQDDARPADRPLRRPDGRRALPRRCAAAVHRQRRAARAARRGVAGAVHVRRHDRRQRRRSPSPARRSTTSTTW